jgi:hypothetical protein
MRRNASCAFRRLTARGAVVLAACWAHVRRKFCEIYKAMASPIMMTVRQIGTGGWRDRRCSQMSSASRSKNTSRAEV